MERRESSVRTTASQRRSECDEPKEGEVTEGNLGPPLFVIGEPERSEGNLSSLRVVTAC